MKNPGQAAGTSFDPATVEIMPDAWVTHVHLLRHGEVVDLEQRQVRGQMDVALSKTGREQSRLLADWFVAVEPACERIFTSDLARCSHLGELLAERTGVALETTDQLREQNMGRWQGSDWQAITEWDGARVTAYWDDYVDTRPPEGESFRDLSDRARAWWDEIVEPCKGKRIAVVSHAGFIRVLLCQLFGVPLTDALRLSPATASHTSLLVSEAGAVLSAFGERPWLFGTQTATR